MSYRLRQTVRYFVYFPLGLLLHIITAKLLQLCCERKLNSLSPPPPPHYQIPDPGFFTEFFQQLPLLELVNVRGTHVDDLALEQMGQF